MTKTTSITNNTETQMGSFIAGFLIGVMLVVILWQRENYRGK